MIKKITTKEKTPTKENKKLKKSATQRHVEYGLNFPNLAHVCEAIARTTQDYYVSKKLLTQSRCSFTRAQTIVELGNRK